MNFVEYLDICLKLLIGVTLWFYDLLPGSYQNADTNRNIYQLIESRGFNYEQHYVETTDGYILQLVRIINPFVKNRSKLHPVFLHHGFQCTGTMWLISANGTLDSKGNYLEYDEDNKKIMINGTVKAGNTLGFVLASRGYDVWLANYRGSIYSTNHSRLSVESYEYWQFSMDEMIHQDLPLQIDYILNETNRSKLSYIGHSQGNLMMLALMSISDYYSSKIDTFIALSPVFYNVEIPSAFSYIIPFHTWLRRFPMLVPFSNETRLSMVNICQNIFLRKLCFALAYPFFGELTQNMIEDRIPAYLSIVAMGSSSWNAAHMFQIFSAPNGQPHYFDYGKWSNKILYGQDTPPNYDVSKVNSTRIALIYTSQDWMNHIKSVKMLKSKLRKKLLDDYCVPDKTYNHMDLTWAKNVGIMVNERILKILQY